MRQLTLEDMLAAIAAEEAGRKMCVHCLKRLANRPRGLCWRCYYAPSVRDIIPRKECNANMRGWPDFCGDAPTAAAATQAVPGTEEKIRVMQERIARGESLHHPDDLTIDPPTRWAMVIADTGEIVPANELGRAAFPRTVQRN